MAKKERFEKTYSQGTVNVTEIWVDTKTGVNYVFHASGYAGGMTPLLDKDGKPVITPVDNNYAMEGIMTFLELAADRYSVRKFKNEPIEEEKLARIIEAAKLAPTACNNQPQKIYVVKSVEKRMALAEVCQCTFDAPVIMAIGYDVERSWKNKLMPGYQSGETDAAIVCTHMMFEAWEQGIGSCWVGWFNADQVEEVLELPEHVVISALLPMGYPEEGVQPANLHTMYRDNSDMVEIL